MRLCDLAKWQILKITCTRCKHDVLVDPRVISRNSKVPFDAELADLERRLKCSSCTVVGQARIEVGPALYQRD